jgi:16S rRNA (cytosine967-C5)-methyltransferase
MTAREIAFDAALRVEKGAWAEEVLRGAVAGLDPRDADLAWELVLGPLRVQSQLDHLIRLYSGKAAKLDAEVRAALRIGIYQLRYLDRIPPHAAVSASVDLVKRARKRSAMGFVNAVLRKVNRDPVAWPSRDVELAAPAWLLARWEKAFGTERATGIARAFLNPPAAPGQDPGAAAIVPLLGVEPGMSVLDLCAAPGNKTRQLVAAGGIVVAADRYGHRLRQVEAEDRVVLDATMPLPFVKRFDRILVDAPCSGTGTLGRNPEIKWRISPADLTDLANRQRAILRQALSCLAPGGRLVYSTCSLEKEENEDVVHSVCRDRVVEEGYRLPGQEPGDGFWHAVIA